MYIPITFFSTDGVSNLCVSASSTATEEGVFLSGSHVWQYWKFENSGDNTLTFHTGSSVDAQIFLVGGGGGGGRTTNTSQPSGIEADNHAGGGGAGGVGFYTNYKLQPRTYNIYVGNGGNYNQDGEDTTIYPLYNSAKNVNEYFPTASYLTAEGGGHGAYSTFFQSAGPPFYKGAVDAHSGGSGGGGIFQTLVKQTDGTTTRIDAAQGSGRVGQGSDGGDDLCTNPYQQTTTGGGGAGEIGQPCGCSPGYQLLGRAGNGKQYNVDGVLRYYGAGGSGTQNNTFSNANYGLGTPGSGGSGSTDDAGQPNWGAGVTPDDRPGKDGIAVVMVPICSASLLDCTTYELFGEGPVSYLPCGSGSEATLETFNVEAKKKYRVCSYGVPSIHGTIYPLTGSCSEVNASGSCSETNIPIDITPSLPNNVHMSVTPVYWNPFSFDYESSEQVYRFGNNSTTHYKFVVDYDTDYWSRDGALFDSKNIGGQSILGIDLSNTATGSCETIEFSSTQAGSHIVEYRHCGDYPTSVTQSLSFSGPFTHKASVNTDGLIYTSSLVTACYYSQSFDQTTHTTSSKAYNVRVTPSNDDFNYGNFSYIDVNGELVSHSISPGTSEDLVMQSIPVHRKTTPPTPIPTSSRFEILSEYTGSYTPYPYYNQLNNDATVRIYKLWPAAGGNYTQFRYWDENGNMQTANINTITAVSSSVIPSVWGTSGYVSDETWRIEPNPHYALDKSIPVTRSLWSLIDIGLTASYDGTGSTLYDIAAEIGGDRVDATFNTDGYDYNTAVLDSGSLISKDSGSVAQIDWPSFDNWNNDITLLVSWFNNGSGPSDYNLFGTYLPGGITAFSLSPTDISANRELARQAVVMDTSDVGTITPVTGSEESAAESGYENVGWHIHQVSYNRSTKTINWNFDGESGSAVVTDNPIYGDTGYYQYGGIRFNNNTTDGLGIPSAVQVFAIYTSSLSLSEMEQNRVYLDSRY